MPLTFRGMTQAYRCGLHSGFRRCCIRYWIKTWVSAPADEVKAHACAFIRAELKMGFRFGYVPCPECIEPSRPAVTVQSCPHPGGPGSPCYGYNGVHWSNLPPVRY